MAEAINWQTEIALIAGPYNGNRKSWLGRAAYRAKISYRQVKALYYGETADPKHSVASSVLKAAEAARREASQLASQFETIAGGLNARDPDFHSEDIAALISAARAIRDLDRT